MSKKTDVNANTSIEEAVKSYVPLHRDNLAKACFPVLEWLVKSKRQDAIDVAKTELLLRLSHVEETMLAHFASFAGGPDFIHRDEAWRLAVRQREAVKEACARLFENPGGEPTASSEAIRELDVGANVKVIPDYSKDLK